jgi:hypothetical protein
MMAREYGVSKPTVRGWALKNNVPYMHGEGIRMCYIFDKESEERFKKRKTVPGPAAGPKTPNPKGKRKG